MCRSEHARRLKQAWHNFQAALSQLQGAQHDLRAKERQVKAAESARDDAQRAHDGALTRFRQMKSRYWDQQFPPENWEPFYGEPESAWFWLPGVK